MGKSGVKDPVAKARKKVAQAQNRYLKAVAKGERQIRNARASADERIARAKAEFELRSQELSDVEHRVEVNGNVSSPENTAAQAAEIAVMPAVTAKTQAVAVDGAASESEMTAKTSTRRHAPARKSAPRKRPT